MTKYPFFSRVRKQSITVLVLLMSGPFCVGQEFSITFLFTDNVGNSDSIRVGFDSTANGEFNPQFGEIDLQAPFESTFEVISVHSIDLHADPIRSKTIISSTEPVFG